MISGDGLEALRHARGKAFAIDRQGAAGGKLVASAARMMSEPARRISSCSRPTALFAKSSERNEFEQTSSASASVLCASVCRTGPHFVQHHRHAGVRQLPGRLASGEAAADHMHLARHDP